MHTCGIPGDSVVKSLPANAGGTGDAGLVAGSGGAPGEGNGNPLQRRLVGYSPWGCKESDTMEHLSTWNLEKWYRLTYLQSRARDADVWAPRRVATELGD